MTAGDTHRLVAEGGLSVPAFDPSRFARALAAHRASDPSEGALSLGRTLWLVDRVGSTQEEARSLVRRGAPHGAIVIAEEQTEGRGRRGRAWRSPRGAGIWATVVLRRGLPEGAPQGLTLAAAVAVCEAARALGAEVDIKWPNDIMAAGGKVAGILGEMMASGDGPCALLGLGVNYDWGGVPMPADIAGDATDLRASGLRADAGREETLAAILARLEGIAACASEGRLSEILARWRALSPSASGRRVSVAEIAGETVCGTTRGVAPDGSLLVEDDAGVTHIVRFGGTLRYEAHGKEERGCF